ncbi:hypothetical protein Tco_1244700 [Tanacetum coccineum]
MLGMDRLTGGINPRNNRKDRSRSRPKDAMLPGLQKSYVIRIESDGVRDWGRVLPQGLTLEKGCTIRVSTILPCVLILKKCYADEPLVMPLEGIHVDDKLQFVKEPVEIMEREIKRLKRSQIPLVKVRWNSRRGPEFTWEREDSFKQKYP